MTRAEEYRHLAYKVRTRAIEEESPILRAEWETLATSYIRLESKPMKLDNSTLSMIRF